jgi:hypothetical protein
VTTPFTLLIVLVLGHTLLELALAPTAGTTRHRIRMVALVGAQGLMVAMAIALSGHQPFVAVSAGVGAAISRVLLFTITSQALQARLLIQTVQLVVLLLIWLTCTDLWRAIPRWLAVNLSDQILLIVLAYLLVFTPTSRLIGALLKPWQANLSSSDSLVNGGALVGNLERGLILSFVLLNQWETVGFLLTAKSILRFNELRGSDHQQRSEYVLLGTLLSFAASVGIGLAAQLLADI